MESHNKKYLIKCEKRIDITLYRVYNQINLKKGQPTRAKSTWQEVQQNGGMQLDRNRGRTAD